MPDHVLLVDDDEDLMEIVSERLKNRGMNVDTVGNAEEALLWMAKKHYNAIILDFLMPGMDGFETIRIIRKQQPDIRIILATGQMLADDGRKAIRMGADVVLEKPADLEVLAKSVRPSESGKDG
ncbi:response regulator [Thermodesulfobacteriota bacterium]